MTTTVIDLSGQAWRITRRLLARLRISRFTRRPSFADGLDAVQGAGSLQAAHHSR
jgi:hypothetical protein